MTADGRLCPAVGEEPSADLAKVGLVASLKLFHAWIVYDHVKAGREIGARPVPKLVWLGWREVYATRTCVRKRNRLAFGSRCIGPCRLAAFWVGLPHHASRRLPLDGAAPRLFVERRARHLHVDCQRLSPGGRRILAARRHDPREQ